MKDKFPPQKIKVPTDGSILEFQSFNEKTKIYTYIYLFSETGLKDNTTIPFTEDVLVKFIANNLLFSKNK